jgi:hypothetical protein
VASTNENKNKILFSAQFFFIIDIAEQLAVFAERNTGQCSIPNPYRQLS